MTRETVIKPGPGEVITIDPVGGANVEAPWLFDEVAS